MKYYVIVKKPFLNKKYAHGVLQPTVSLGLKQCSGCHSPQKHEIWPPPLDMKVSNKKCIGDVIYGPDTAFIISQKFKEKFEQSDLRGLSNFRNLRRVYYHGKPSWRDEPLDLGYYYSEVAQITAWIDESYIEFRNKKRKEPCPVCQFRNYPPDIINGIVFTEPAKIDQDIFYSLSLGNAHLIVSERFKSFVKEEGFTNITFWDADKFHASKNDYIFPDGKHIRHKIKNGKILGYEDYTIADNQVIIKNT